MDGDYSKSTGHVQQRSTKWRSTHLGVSVVLYNIYHTSTEYPAILILIYFLSLSGSTSCQLSLFCHVSVHTCTPFQSPNDPFLSYHICCLPSQVFTLSVCPSPFLSVVSLIFTSLSLHVSTLGSFKRIFQKQPHPLWIWGSGHRTT